MHHKTRREHTTRIEPTGTRVAAVETEKISMAKEAMNVRVLCTRSQLGEKRRKSSETHDHISKAYGRAYRMDKCSKPRVLCVMLARKSAY